MAVNKIKKQKKTGTLRRFVGRNLSFLILLEVAILIVVAYIFLFQQPLQFLRSSEVGDLNQQIQTKETQRQQLAAELERVKQQPEDLLLSVLPNDPEVRSLFAQVENVMDSLGFRIESMSVEDEGIKNLQRRGRGISLGTPSVTAQQGGALDSVKKVTISLQVSGSTYKSFKELLRGVERFERITDVHSVQFASREGVDGSGQAQAVFSLSLTTYYLP
ncbi:MAG: hypothetical protein HOJ15_03680 [Candidatus Jacksonbacteria bacterium]|jgi:Tfp pilus assembly protein PilO|nr:hypothetical protein [Candidatus Jacksonbacteria bacterium]MBT6034216.1 hypothetical protein [Candidatus Jacksonbacteria bacterium]MBT6301500.1 hypothetical protein [Candidatus Jacksonbacteria bacterium]MBT6757551.1 hypothetical protein [Candidatus Jacksonbacteria bacterium]MBT6955281.1 hypothetical protein [Candidatus Jacksonbacteria bacterium]